MRCPNCGRQYDAEQSRTCPYCGDSNPVVRSGAVKKSLVLIASGKSRAVYGSVEEVPAPLRKQLLKSTSGLNSATVLIADRRGREEITRAIRNLPAGMQRRLLRLILGEGEENPVSGSPLSRLAVKVAAVLLAGAASLLVWLAFTARA
jgi:hypothetical protein